MPEVEPEEKDHSECKPENEIEMIINLIINFLRKLFGLPAQCYCGEKLN